MVWKGGGRRTWGADEDDASCFGELHFGCVIDGETGKRVEVEEVMMNVIL